MAWRNGSPFGLPLKALEGYITLKKDRLTCVVFHVCRVEGSG